jgi:hypothetical protein
MTDLLDTAFLETRRLPPGTDLADTLRTFVEHTDIRVPYAWTLAHGNDDIRDPDNVSLTFGISPHGGALVWYTHDETMVPTDGTNTDWVRYHFAGLHDTYLPPGAEVSRETVYQTVAEFMTTLARPTCVNWRTAPDELLND